MSLKYTDRPWWTMFVNFCLSNLTLSATFLCYIFFRNGTNWSTSKNGKLLSIINTANFTSVFCTRSFDANPSSWVIGFGTEIEALRLFLCFSGLECFLKTVFPSSFENLTGHAKHKADSSLDFFLNQPVNSLLFSHSFKYFGLCIFFSFSVSTGGPVVIFISHASFKSDKSSCKSFLPQT